MNVKRIVLKAGEELPEVCWECEACQGISPDYLYCMGKHIDIDAHNTRPSWCPLQVEEVCEWKIKPSTAKWYGKPMYDIVKQCDPDSFYSAVIDKDKEAKCNCGKCIKYVEVK